MSRPNTDLYFFISRYTLVFKLNILVFGPQVETGYIIDVFFKVEPKMYVIINQRMCTCVYVYIYTGTGHKRYKSNSLILKLNFYYKLKKITL